LSAFLLIVVSSAGATTYYRVSDLCAWGGGGSGTPAVELNDCIPPDSGWTLVQVTETFDTGHLIGWGTVGDAERVFGLTPLEQGDANADGRVDGGDLALWQQKYDPLSQGAVDFFSGDWNDDGRVDGGDLALWQQNYDPLPSAEFPYEPSLTHMPEPVTMLGLTLGVGMIVGVLRRRRTM